MTMMNGRRRSHAMRLLAITLALAPWHPLTASAQPHRWHPSALTVGLGAGALWDDETNLGRGVPVAGGLDFALGEHVVASGGADWTSHVRDSGYLRSEGTLLGTFVRGTFLAGSRRSTVRPAFGTGLGLLRSTGTLIMRSTLAGPGGVPMAGPEGRQPWRLTSPAFELHGGMHVRLSDRWTLRPEGRWRGTLGRDVTPGIEAPLIGLQGMVHVGVGL